VPNCQRKAGELKTGTPDVAPRVAGIPSKGQRHLQVAFGTWDYACFSVSRHDLVPTRGVNRSRYNINDFQPCAIESKAARMTSCKAGRSLTL
jgi:hypothetical protein